MIANIDTSLPPFASKPGEYCLQLRSKGLPPSTVVKFEMIAAPAEQGESRDNTALPPQLGDQVVKEAPVVRDAVTLRNSMTTDDWAREGLAVAAKRRLIVDRHSPWQMTLAVMGLGTSAELLQPGADPREIRALDWLLSGPTFRGEPVWQRTDFGAQGHPYSTPYVFQGHPAQFLACLAAAGVTRNTPLHAMGVNGARQALTVSDVVADAKQQIHQKEEHGWTLWALATYEPVDAAWTNRLGEPWSLARLVDAEASANFDSAPNGGCVKALALAVALAKYRAVDPESGAESPQPWRQVEERLSAQVAAAKSLQFPDGAIPIPLKSAAVAAATPQDRLKGTALQMAWLVEAVSSEQLKSGWIQRAIARIGRDLVETRQEALDVETLAYSAYVLRRYRERTGSARRSMLSETGTARPTGLSDPYSTELLLNVGFERD
ncbi:MAG: hypothetical protein B7Z55_14025, partial [Planctomycetales bacterium 12-60-4]